ncbi:hypothetical protein HMSSN139_37400 [Paenibacillus sp. HMSSN-139]|nr:hypothetical protein HMSSN139_37400 [Paenibacillus sp. HMSSN-139]
MIATIEREIVHRKGWMSREEIGDMVSISGSAPGGVAVNSAAFIGYRLGGVIGAVAAVTAITMPTFLIVFLLSALSAMYKDNAKVAAALKGIHAAVVALIIVAAAKMWKSSVLDTATLVIMALAVAALLLTSIHSVYLILGGPIAGIAIVFVKKNAGWSYGPRRHRPKKHGNCNSPNIISEGRGTPMLWQLFWVFCQNRAHLLWRRICRVNADST